MKTSDKLRFVRQNMKKNKSRIFMTVLATAMGCAFLLMIASVAFGLQKSIVNDIMQDRSLTEIQANAKKDGDSYRALTRSDITELKAIDHVKAVTAERYLQARATVDGYAIDSNVIMSDYAEEAKKGLDLDRGRAPENENETVVGYHFAAHLSNGASENNYEGDPLGQTLSFHTVSFDPKSNKEIDSAPVKLTIVGVAAKPDREWMEDTSFRVSDKWSGQLLPGGDETAGSPDVKLYADGADEVAAISKQLRAQNYQIYSVADSISQYDLVFLVMKIGLIFVGTIAVLIASIGIYNTMTMAVTERAQDIGILKAIGAHPRTIRSVFLLESFGIGVLGVVIGTAVAYGLSALVNAFVPSIMTAVLHGDKPPEDFVFSSIPLILTLVSIVISLGVAILSGMRPAARATRIDVLRALRRDI